MSEPSDILTTHEPVRLPSVTQSMQLVAQKHGVSVWRQVYQIVRLRYGRGKLSPFEYYRFKVWRKSLSWAERRGFLGDNQAKAFNASLTAPEHAKSYALVDDKPVFLALAEASGLPVTPTQAFFATHRRIGQWRHLQTREELTDFLLNKARYPLFGKPGDGSSNLGAVQLHHCDDDGYLWHNPTLRGPHAQALAAEIALKYPSGYLLQDCVMMADDLAPLAPEGLGPLRLLTIYDTPNTPSFLMAYLRLPVQGTEVGPDRAKRRLYAKLCAETLTISQAYERANGEYRPIEVQPATGAKLTGYPVPSFAEAIDLALRAHRLVPQIGMIGWDIALGAKGAQLVEGNWNPSLTSVQSIPGTGILSSAHAARYAAAQARAKAQSEAIRAGKAEWELGAIRDMVAMEKRNRR